MRKTNHIIMLKNFFSYMNFYDCNSQSINIEKKEYSISMEEKQFRCINFKGCNVFFRNFLPYKVEKLKSGNYIFLNREYKPLGTFFEKSWVDYEQFNFLSFEYKKGDINNIFFYHSKNNPSKSKKYFIEYLIRLKYFLIDYKNNRIVLEKDYYRDMNLINKGN